MRVGRERVGLGLVTGHIGLDRAADELPDVGVGIGGRGKGVGVEQRRADYGRVNAHGLGFRADAVSEDLEVTTGVPHSGQRSGVARRS